MKQNMPKKTKKKKQVKATLGIASRYIHQGGSCDSNYACDEAGIEFFDDQKHANEDVMGNNNMNILDRIQNQHKKSRKCVVQ